MSTTVSLNSINELMDGIMRKSFALLAFALLTGGIGKWAAAEEQSSDTATIIVTREKAYTYVLLGANISVNGEKKAKLKNGKTVQLTVPSGKNTFGVKGSTIPGSSTITFDCKSSETYELKVSPRKDSVLIGGLGGVVGGGLGSLIALKVADANAEASEGGGFRIRMVSTSETEAQEAQPTQIDTPSSSTQETDTVVTSGNADEVKIEVDEGEVVKETVEIKPRVSEFKEEKKTKPPLREESSDLYQTLLELDDLRQRGILTEEEFQSEKRKVLDDE